MSMKSHALFILGLFSAASASAGWILIPVSAAAPLPGAHGSLWSVRLSAYNGSAFPTTIGPGKGECQLSSCEGVVLAPGETTDVPFFGYVHDGLGDFLYVTGFSDSVDFYYRTRDESRRLETAGTMLPILRERDAPAGDLDLIGIPIESGFRVMLRLYGMTGPQAVRIDVHPMGGGGILASAVAALVDDGTPDGPPAQAQVPDLGALVPGFVGEVRIHVEVPDDASVWGFATVTHNETQHVTVVEAQ